MRQSFATRRPLRTLALVLGSAAALLVPALDPAASEPRAARLTPKEKARVELGRRLFFEPVVSRSGARSCASCHDPEHGFSDREPTSADDVGRTRRKSQTLNDSAFNPNAHWDGVFESLEDLITARIRPVSNGKGLSSHGAALGEAGGQAGDTGERRPAPSTPAQPPPPAAPPTPPTQPPAGGGGGGGDPYGGGEFRRPESEEPPPADPGAPTTPPAAEGQPAPSAPAPTPAPAPAAAPAGPAGPEAKGDAKDGQAAQPPAQPAEKPAAPAKADEPDPEVPLDVRKLPRVDVTLETAGRYREAFQAAYGSDDVSVARIADAIGAYCRTIQSTRSPYDRFVEGEKGALTAEQERGLALFTGPARCATCHLVKPGPSGRALFTDYLFHDTGVAWREFGRPAKTQTRAGAILEPDKGRELVSTRPADRRAFKTPSLRDVAVRGPWFHDGSAATLEDTVRYYVGGGSADPAKSPHVSPLELSDADVRALVRFLEALTGEERPARAQEAWVRRAEQAELTFVDGGGQRLAGFAVTVTAAGDVLPGWSADQDAPQHLVTDARGTLSYRVPPRTHVRLTLPEGLVPAGGDLVPDTCAKVRVTVPVDGRIRLVLDAPAARPLPARLTAEHLGTMRLPGHAAPTTLLLKVGTIAGAEGRSLTLYAGWRRTDLPTDVRLHLGAGPGGPIRGPRVRLDGPVQTVALALP